MPADRHLRSDAVHERLRREILDGRLAPGDPLPSERALAGELSVNRHAIREAVKRLQQAGLVQVSQGGATRVLDWRRTGGLELLGDLAAHAGPAVLRDVAEMRASVGADAARLCAARTTAAERDRLRALAARHGAAATFDARLEAYEALWEAIVEGSGNLAYRLAYNALVAARHERGGIDPRVYAAEVDDPAASAAIAAAVASGDGEQAAAVARRVLERTARDGRP